MSKQIVINLNSQSISLSLAELVFSLCAQMQAKPEKFTCSLFCDVVRSFLVKSHDINVLPVLCRREEADTVAAAAVATAAVRPT